jgi:sec-independent protein translocase protein TatC
MTKPAMPENTEMPFLDHLEELRWRLLWSLAAFIIGVVLSFVLLTKFDVIGILARPVQPYLGGGKLVFTHPGDAFGIILDAALGMGAVLASPVIGYQLWSFLAPALHKHEKRMVLPVLIGGIGLFMAGVALAFFVVLPITLRFLMGFQTSSLSAMITADKYFGMAISMCLLFGTAFELPIAILALTALGIVTPAFLNKYRRHAVVLVLVASAFITPGADPTSLFALALPLYFLFELSVLLSLFIYRARLRRESRRALEESAPSLEGA